jgi:hypothetical protein
MRRDCDTGGDDGGEAVDEEGRGEEGGCEAGGGELGVVEAVGEAGSGEAVGVVVGRKGGGETGSGEPLQIGCQVEVQKSGPFKGHEGVLQAKHNGYLKV